MVARFGVGRGNSGGERESEEGSGELAALHGVPSYEAILDVSSE
jgi:hypothetical protein